jgi:hypothetical protein
MKRAREAVDTPALISYTLNDLPPELVSHIMVAALDLEEGAVWPGGGIRDAELDVLEDMFRLRRVCRQFAAVIHALVVQPCARHLAALTTALDDWTPGTMPRHSVFQAKWHDRPWVQHMTRVGWLFYALVAGVEPAAWPWFVPPDLILQCHPHHSLVMEPADINGGDDALREATAAALNWPWRRLQRLFARAGMGTPAVCLLYALIQRTMSGVAVHCTVVAGSEKARYDSWFCITRPLPDLPLAPVLAWLTLAGQMTWVPPASPAWQSPGWRACAYLVQPLLVLLADVILTGIHLPAVSAGILKLIPYLGLPEVEKTSLY